MEATNTVNPIHRISVEQFHCMIEAGVFADGDRIELTDGPLTVTIEGVDVQLDVGELLAP